MRVAFGAALLVVCLALVAPSSSFALWPEELHEPALYIIEGYLDRAPKGTKIADRIEIAAGQLHHTLLVTRYGTPGETDLDRYLSRVMAKPFIIRGADEDVRRMMGAPSGTRIAGTFAVYTHGVPSLMIGDLTDPPPSS